MSAGDPAPSLGPGYDLGRGRRVVRPLAVGRKNEVYLVWDGARRVTVVVKVVRPERLPRKLRKLEEEAALLARLAHPQLVRGLDAVLDGSPPHLVLEHVEGPPLRDLLRRGPVEPGLVAAVGLQMAGVLHYLATEGLVHLDLKPHNVLMAPALLRHSLEPREGGVGSTEAGGKGGPAGTAVKLIDIGGIKPIGDRTGALGQDVPEHRGGPTAIAAPAGVWLLGGTMARALTGGSEGFDADLRSGLPGDAGLSPLLSACLDPDPAARPTAEALAEALEPLALAPPAAPAAPRRAPRRTRRLRRGSP